MPACEAREACSLQEEYYAHAGDFCDGLTPAVRAIRTQIAHLTDGGDREVIFAAIT